MKIILKMFVVAILTIGLTNCGEHIHAGKTRINCEYPNGVILHKYQTKYVMGAEHYDILHNGEVHIFVLVYDIDSGYNVGDTINKPCLKN